MPQMFDELVVTSNKNTGTGWINAFYKGFVGNSLENNKMYRVKDFGSNKYYVVDQNNTHSVEKDIAFYSQLSQENKSFIFYKLQEPCGVLIIPSYLKIAKTLPQSSWVLYWDES